MAVGLGGAWLGGDAEERRGEESVGSRTRDDDARDDVDGMGWIETSPPLRQARVQTTEMSVVLWVETYV
jgi:hypothetical protein